MMIPLGRRRTGSRRARLLLVDDDAAPRDRRDRRCGLANVRPPPERARGVPRPRAPPQEIEQDDDDAEDEQDHAHRSHVQPPDAGIDGPRQDRAERGENETHCYSHAIPVPIPRLETRALPRNHGFRAERMNVPGTRAGSLRHEPVPGYSSSCLTWSPALARTVTTCPSRQKRSTLSSVAGGPASSKCV